MPSKADEFRRAILDNRARVISREPRIDAMAARFTDQVLDGWLQELRKANGGRILSSSEMADIRRKVAILRQANRKITASTVSALRAEVRKLSVQTFVGETIRHTSLIGELGASQGRVAAAFSGLNERAIRAALADRVPLAAQTESFKHISRRVQQAMGRDVAKAIAEGWKVDQLAESWARKRPGTAASLLKSDSRTLARTSVMQASSQAQLFSYQQSGAAKGVIWDATFDSRTCTQCASLHGRRFVFGTEPPMPAHPNCRCNWLMWFTDPDDNALLDDIEAYRLPDSSTGYRRADRSFDSFLKKSDAGVQRDFFGSRLKREAWKSGDVPLEKMLRLDGSLKSDAEIALLIGDPALIQKYNSRALASPAVRASRSSLPRGPLDARDS